MNAIDADTDSLLIARLAELLGPLTDGPTADAVRAELNRLADGPTAAGVRAELDRLAGTPLPTLTPEYSAPPMGPTAAPHVPHVPNGHGSRASRTAGAVLPC